jgi:hypothetical protein
MHIHSSRKKIPELLSSVRTKADPIEVTDPARRERGLLAKIIQLGRHFLSTDASYNLSVQKRVWRVSVEVGTPSSSGPTENGSKLARWVSGSVHHEKNTLESFHRHPVPHSQLILP